MEPFSPSYNAVVGRNGSGKSNFFSAIRFVLNDAYTKVTPEERQALLHEGSGTATMSAFVEVVFDNSDGRFPTGKEEVVLRRTVGLKKDEFSLDKKTITKSDVMNLLQSAGFSKSNPYYIVPQGRITALTNARESERLQLLKEVAGTQVYEEHRQESLKIMEETDLKRQKIVELLTFIDERMSELEEEKEELKQFQLLDKEKRCLEYSIYSKDQTEINEQIENLEEEFRNENNDFAAKSETLQENLDKLKDSEESLKRLKRELNALEQRKIQTSLEKNNEIKEMSKYEMSAQHQKKQAEFSKRDKKTYEEELKMINSSIKEKEAQLAKINPKYESASEKESKAKMKLATIESERDSIYAKMGRKTEFKSNAEREKWLKSEISNLEQDLIQAKRQEIEFSKEFEEATEQSISLEKEVSSFSSGEKERKASLKAIENELYDLKKERDSKNERRKELWREENKLETSIGILKEECSKSERQLSAILDKSTSLGLQSLKKMASKYGIHGVYGPLYELFEVDEVYQTAVDVVGGSSLFHVVVENDDVATKLLEVMIQEKLGRLTFMPLNRLKNYSFDYPEGQDTIPLIKKLRFDPKLSLAFKQVFGKAVVCPDLTIASNISKQYNLNALTLDGDRIDKKGAMTGGFMDAKKSRMKVMISLKQWRSKLEENEVSLLRTKREIQLIEQEITRIVGSINNAEEKRRKFSHLDEELQSKVSALSAARTLMESKKRFLENAKVKIINVETKLNYLRNELKDGKKGSDDNEKLSLIYEEIEKLQSELRSVGKERSDLALQKADLENELNLNLRKRKFELVKKLDEQSGDDVPEEKIIENYAMVIENCEKREKEIDANMDEIAKRIREINATIDHLKQLCNEKQRKAEHAQISIDKYLTRKNFLIQRKDECLKKIRELGILPEEAFSGKNMASSMTQLLKKLHSVNEKLSNFMHVNRKAFDQYGTFTKQRESLVARRQELDDSESSIKEFIHNLDQRKDEAILNTFRQVQANFSEVFDRLVPHGKGSLTLLRDEDKSASSSSMQYTGIGINVSFVSKNEEDSRMQQLSGGQKSLVALALIFAIQKCDPAPFYLFDEIDANLDTAYRASVANLIKDLSQNAQFIMTTFRPELLQHADKYYGVSFANKVSSIECISKEHAMEFVEREIVAK